jgi:hypothetical protein
MAEDKDYCGEKLVWPKNSNIPFSLWFWCPLFGLLFLISPSQRLIVCDYQGP